ncbi:dihydrofolate reductase [Flavobacterium frigidarium]|uniref:dihydrofolate reductase n=1 Tax=Flavobacterium frigidarium TaxID=99286 RepID=UPI00047D25B9|nr:dihydrofolate reductase [Flavobacterium frigidarium]
MTTMIAAAAENNALGKDNKIIWHLPDDYKRFKEITSGHHIIMGRKTFESLQKPLPNRTHIVISRQENYNPEGCTVVRNIKEALAACPENEDRFIIGGGEIYNLALPEANKIELTRVHHSFDADAFFPEIDLNEWELIQSKLHPTDERHKYEFTYETYIRK